MIEINHAQKRSIQTSLWLLDEMLCIFQRYLTIKDLDSVLYKEVNTLSDKQCKIIIKEIDALRHLIIEIASQFELSQHISYVGKTIQSLCIHSITDLIEPLIGKGLHAYGDLSAPLSSYLNPRVMKIIEKLEHIAKIGHDSIQ